MLVRTIHFLREGRVARLEVRDHILRDVGLLVLAELGAGVEAADAYAKAYCAFRGSAGASLVIAEARPPGWCCSKWSVSRESMA